ncbi:MAG: DNA repair protein RecO [Opitutia bacterium UBA7350]|nr:MAG: DNA repair protein RecO [Opitutae bacterium UBA7350]
MSQPAVSEQALVLCLDLSGESYQRISALSADSGCFVCLKRGSKKSPLKDAPDLFDTAEIDLENARGGNTRFVRNYRTLYRRSQLGSSYRTLSYVAEFTKLIARNAPLMGDYPLLFQLTEQSLDAFCERPHPEIVHLKSLYKLLQAEGYPVRESWWPQLSSKAKAQASNLLNQPTPDEASKEQLQSAISLTESICNWLQRETDFVLP